jgi:putative mRNA 3-end processing factor
VSNAILQTSPEGLYCPAGDFFIDPWSPVARAVITHSHSDHARLGNGTYLTALDGERVLRYRMGSDAVIETVAYGETRSMNGVSVSLHPAGHVLGSAQVRVEYRGEVWVASGDYKLAPDPTCAAFESIRCHTFITESTFGLPIYRWSVDAAVFNEINQWWRHNQETGKASVIFAYSLGKAQRVLAGIDSGIGPIFAHGAVRNLNRCYRESGVTLPDAASPFDAPKGCDWSRALIVAPPSAHGSTWIRRFGAVSTAFASGWMRIRGTRRRKYIDRGFVLSDHADWPGLLEAIRLTEAECIWVTHGYRSPLVRWLTEQGREAKVVETRWEDDELAGGEGEAEPDS